MIGAGVIAADAAASLRHLAEDRLHSGCVNLARARRRCRQTIRSSFGTGRHARGALHQHAARRMRLRVAVGSDSTIAPRAGWRRFVRPPGSSTSTSTRARSARSSGPFSAGRPTRAIGLRGLLPLVEARPRCECISARVAICAARIRWPGRVVSPMQHYGLIRHAAQFAGAGRPRHHGRRHSTRLWVRRRTRSRGRDIAHLGGLGNHGVPSPGGDRRQPGATRNARSFASPATAAC